MGRLIEDVSLRDKIQIFKDRQEAGRLLTQRLTHYSSSKGIILAIPSGGVSVAYEIAQALNLPMDLILVRKIQIPYNPEAGFGAVSPDGNVVFNKTLLRELMITEEEIKDQVNKSLDSIKKRNEIFRANRPFPPLNDRTVIIVDDGLASGYTMLSAICFVKKENPEKTIVAVPTAPKRTVGLILPEVSEVVCLNIRSGFSFAVADAYKNWYDLSDEDVLAILQK